jgi:hypothetical protein
MLGVKSEEEQIVAVLHDVVEDCPAWNFERLRGEGFSPRIVAALEAVTKRDREDYEAFVRRAASNPIGRAVKLADLRDNCDLSRIANPSERNRERLRKYRRALDLIVRI